MESTQPTKEEFLDELENDERQCFQSGRLNNITDIVLSILAVVGSLVATILAAVKNIDNWVIAAFAAIPAASTSLQQIVDFRGRSIWYFGHSAKLSALAVSLRYAANPYLEDYANRRAEIEIEGDTAWKQIGSGKTVPKLRRNPKKPHPVD